MAGIGAADVVAGQAPADYHDVFEAIAACLKSQDSDSRYFGGFCFPGSSTTNEVWQSLGAFRFVLPAIQIINRRDRGSQLICNVPVVPRAGAADRFRAALDALGGVIFQDCQFRYVLPRPTSRVNLPCRDGWTDVVNRALAQIESGDLAKIVLARESTVTFDGVVNPQELLQRMKQRSPNTFCFCLQPDRTTAFIGVTPERLYQRRKSVITTEAVAGTRGNSAPGVPLLHGAKERREHRLVADHIREAYDSLCRPGYQASEVSVLKLRTIQHLRQTFTGILRRGAADADVFSTLYPTPAVGGYPCSAAPEFIRFHERFHRGWYAGAVGWIGGNEAEFAVAIRSGIVRGRTYRFFAGAGIVDGSRPEEEWEELERKSDSFNSTVWV